MNNALNHKPFFELQFYFEIIDMDIFQSSSICIPNKPKEISADLLKYFLKDESSSLNIINNLSSLQIKAFLKPITNSSKCLIIERHMFNPAKLILTEIEVEDYDIFLSFLRVHVFDLGHITENTNEFKRTENVNVLGFLDQVCKNTKDKLKLIDFEGYDETYAMKMGFFKDISATSKKKSRNYDLLRAEETDPKGFFINEYYGFLYGPCFPFKQSTTNHNGRLTRFIKVQVKQLLYKYCQHAIKNNVSEEAEKTKSTNNTILYKTIIENSAMSNIDIDNKYKTDNLTYKDKNSQIINEYEYQFDLNYQRSAFILKNWNILLLGNKKDQSGHVQEEEVIETLVNIFKIRELQLQIIIYLELLTFTNLDTNFSRFDEIYGKSEPRKKLGKLFGINSKQKPMTKKERQVDKDIDLCQKLNYLVNKLCVAESLIPKSMVIDAHEQEIQDDLNLNKQNFKLASKKKISSIPAKLIINWHLKNCLFNERSDESLIGFYTNCLVPVYKKKLPKCLKFLQPKFMGTSFDISLSAENKINKEVPYNIKDLRQEPNKNLKELLNSDVSLLQRQESSILSAQERVKLLEKRITSLDKKSIGNSKHKTTRVIKRSHSMLVSNELDPTENLLETPSKAKNQMIDINGEKFKRAKLRTNQVSFLRTGSSRTVSLLDKLAQTFNETGETPTSSVKNVQNEENDNSEQKIFMEDLFNRFSQKINNNVNESDSGSDMVIQATPQKIAEMIQSPMKSHIMSSGIKASVSKNKKSPLSGIVHSSGGKAADGTVSNDVIESPMIKSSFQYTAEHNILSSSPWKTPRIGAIEEELGPKVDNPESTDKVKRKLFSFDE